MVFTAGLRAFRNRFVTFPKHFDRRLLRACAAECRRIACVENLEQRRLMTTTYSAGALSISLSSASTVTLSLSGGSVVVTENGSPTNTGAAPSAISSISVTGSSGADNVDLSFVTIANGFTNASLSGQISLSGGAGNDTLRGSDLADSISGGDDNDLIFGNAGNDSINGDAGGDNIMGNAGSDVLDGGSGSDIINYSLSPAGVVVTFDGSANDGTPGENDNVLNCETFYGSSYADSVTGGPENDQFLGAGGNDTLLGEGGNDYLNGGAGDDYLDGGSGSDLLDYTQDIGGATIVINSTCTDGWGNTDTTLNMENVYGSPYADSITGDSANNFISGGAGNDTIHGGDGDDTLRGDAGNNVIIGDAGNDSADYTVCSTGVSVTLDGTANDGVPGQSDNVDTENVLGSAYADYIAGDSAANSFLGNGGNDTLIGNGGNDSLAGASGIDTVDYSTSPAGVTATINGSASDGFGGADTLYDIENLVGSPYADSLTGSSANNSIDGGAGNDTITGGAGDDFITAGSGNDSITSSSGNDTLHSASGNDTLSVTGGTLTVDTAQVFSSLSISSGASLNLASGAGDFVTSSVTLSSGGTLDIADNFLAINYTGSSPFSTIRADITTGYDASDWLGTGITSSTAAADPDLSHGIAYAENSELGWSTLGANSIDSTTVILGYTWYGDANLDGTVDHADFSLVDTSVATFAGLNPVYRPDFATWTKGNFNYDTGTDTNGFAVDINADDYTLMNNSYNLISDAYFSSLPTITIGSTNNATGDYTGAYLDGSTDDHTVIQNALDYLADHGGGTVVIPGPANLGSSGLSLINTLTRSYDNIRILGDGVDSVLTLDTAPSFSTSTPLYNGPGVVMLFHASNIIIRGIEFDGTGIAHNAAGTYANGISMIDSQNCVVDNDEFHDFNSLSNAIWSLANEYTHYTNNYFHDNSGNCIYAGNFWRSTQYYLHGDESDLASVFIGNIMRSSSGDGVVGHVPDATFVANDIDFSGGGHSGISLAATGPHDSDTWYVSSSGAVVLGNSIANVGWHDIQSDDLDGGVDNSVTIMSNLLSDPGSGSVGILANQITNWLVVDNTIDLGGAYHGIQVLGADNMLIRNNSITGAAHAGIDIDSNSTFGDISNLTIIDNYIADNGNQGILLLSQNSSTLSWIDIESNTIADNPYGIQISAQDSSVIQHIYILDNEIDDSTCGIYGRDTGSAVVSDIGFSPNSYSGNTTDTDVII